MAAKQRPDPSLWNVNWISGRSRKQGLVMDSWWLTISMEYHEEDIVARLGLISRPIWPDLATLEEDAVCVRGAGDSSSTAACLHWLSPRLTQTLDSPRPALSGNINNMTTPVTHSQSGAGPCVCVCVCVHLSASQCACVSGLCVRLHVRRPLFQHDW